MMAKCNRPAESKFNLRNGGDTGKESDTITTGSVIEGKVDGKSSFSMKEGTLKKLLVLMGIFVFLLPLVFLGCEGDDGAQGPQGIQGPEGPAGPGVGVADVNPESCSVCHKGEPRDGDAHQAAYDELYQDNVVVVTILAYANDNVSDTVTFKMTKNGADFDCTELSPAAGDSLGIYFTTYTGTSFEQAERLSLGTAGSSSAPSTLSYDSGTNTCTSTVPQSAAGDLSGTDGLIVVYGRNERVGTVPNSRVQLAKYPFAGLLETGAGVDYVSAANTSGCEKCHTVPFLKHGYIYGQVNGDPTNDFYTCKACHQDNGEGGHFIWQLLVNDPQLIFTLEAEYGGDWEEDGAADPRLASYQYKTRLMNDVHMSHAMEFAYPQSMSTCNTCHEDKLDLILTAENFTAETCKSCHAVSGPGKEKQAPALETIWIDENVTFHNINLTCNESASCHGAGSSASFSDIHSGYDKKIYDAAGTKYSSAITVSIDNASFVANNLTIAFSATGNLAGADSAEIVPTVLVGLYGYDTKDFIVGPHERDADRNRLLEFAVDNVTVNPRFTVVKADPGSWEVIADLSMWADMIDNTVKKVEIAVMPALDHPTLKDEDGDPVLIALNAPSKTFDLGTNAFVAFPGSTDIVKVEGCNNCHDALATTFHSGNRGGNVVVCRLCHITKSGGSHLEMQSRSIDSYAHAIHSFQAFDIGDIDFADQLEALEYEHHIDSHFPTFGTENCLACHNAGKFNVPDQSKSLPGLLSASDAREDELFVPVIFPDGLARNIGDVPSYITGPATRACGACHRAHAINEDASGELASLFSHWRTFGYVVEADANNQDSQDNLLAVIDEIFSSL